MPDFQGLCFAIHVFNPTHAKTFIKTMPIRISEGILIYLRIDQ